MWLTWSVWVMKMLGSCVVTCQKLEKAVVLECGHCNNVE